MKSAAPCTAFDQRMDFIARRSRTCCARGWPWHCNMHDDNSFAGGPMTTTNRTTTARRSHTVTPTRINRLDRLRTRLRDTEWRRYGYLLLAGKALGLVAVFGVATLIASVIG